MGVVPLILVWESGKVPVCFLFFLGLMYLEAYMVYLAAEISFARTLKLIVPLFFVKD
jgi:hypothetical protein